MTKIYDAIIVGGGAAGLVCAGFAAKRFDNVLIIERNDRVARKVMITGKGRCNVTNLCDRDTFISSIPRNGRFMYGAYSAFSPYDMIDLLDEYGVKTKVERGNRVFPVSDKAVDVVDALRSFAERNGAEIIHKRVQSLIIENGAAVGVCCEDESENEKYYARNIVVATGGLSYPQTGSTGDGYTLAKQAGHNIIMPIPSLVPLVILENYASQMQGLSLKNTALKVVDNQKNKVIYDDFGEMLFTHFGVSGPMILSASAHLRDMSEKRYTLLIDLKPALDEKTLDDRILRDFSENINREYINSLDKLLPKKMVPVVVKLSKIEPRTKVNQITREQRLKIVSIIKNLPLTVMKFRPVDEAIVTSGGVDVKQINPKTMQSKLCDNLYFAGEVIDVDGYTGGFNLQIAFSTACIVGKSMV